MAYQVWLDSSAILKIPSRETLTETVKLNLTFTLNTAIQYFHWPLWFDDLVTNELVQNIL